LQKLLPAFFHLERGKDGFDKQRCEDIWYLCCGLCVWWEFSAVWFLPPLPMTKAHVPVLLAWRSLIYWKIFGRPSHWASCLLSSDGTKSSHRKTSLPSFKMLLRRNSIWLSYEHFGDCY
jgi:hypothetical protein